MKEIDCTIHGKVQGVFFRKFIKERADKLGLYGFVQNTEEGTVDVVAQGEEEKLHEFVDLMKNGPVFARITSVDVVWNDISQDSFTEFSIEHD